MCRSLRVLKGLELRCKFPAMAGASLAGDRTVANYFTYRLIQVADIRGALGITAYHWGVAPDGKRFLILPELVMVVTTGPAKTERSGTLRSVAGFDAEHLVEPARIRNVCAVARGGCHAGRGKPRRD